MVEKSNSKFSVCIVQNLVTPDKDKNLNRVLEMIDSSVKLYSPDLIVLAEYFNCPLEKNYALDFAEDENDSSTLRALGESAKKNNVYLIAGTIPTKTNTPKISNTCFCFDNKGEIKAKYRKVHLFDVDIPGKIKFCESEKTIPGDAEDFITTFETPFATFGIGICYDIRFSEQCQLLKKLKNIDCMVYLSAFSIPTGTLHWDLLSRARAVDNNVHVIMSSQSRNYNNPDAHQIFGGSRVVDPFGNVLNTLCYEEGVLYSIVDLQLNKNVADQIPTWKNRKNEIYDVILKKDENKNNSK